MTEPHQKTVLILDNNAQWYADALAKKCPDLRYIAVTDHAEALDHAPQAEVILGLAPLLTTELINAAVKLQWVQSLTSGVERIIAMGILDPDIALTNCAGLHGPQVSELVFLLMLSLNRKYPKMLDNQQSKTWDRWPQPLLLDKTVTIAGVGRIAEELALRCTAFGMNVIGVSDGRDTVPNFTKIYKRDALQTAVAGCDFLVMLMPYDARSHHIINASVFAAMPSEARLISVSRGNLIDEVALRDALHSGQIAGAGLDVFANEPLAPSDPIWTAPNTIITPHIGGMSDIFKQQALHHITDNIIAFAKGGAENLQGIIRHSKNN